MLGSFTFFAANSEAIHEPELDITKKEPPKLVALLNIC